MTKIEYLIEARQAELEEATKLFSGPHTTLYTNRLKSDIEILKAMRELEEKIEPSKK